MGSAGISWKRSPTGLVDTEGGLYLAPRDLAKIAYLYLKKGAWEGKPIVPPEWVEASIAPSVTVSAVGVKYGYKWWLYPYGTVSACTISDGVAAKLFDGPAS